MKVIVESVGILCVFLWAACLGDGQGKFFAADGAAAFKDRLPSFFCEAVQAHQKLSWHSFASCAFFAALKHDQSSCLARYSIANA